MEHTLVIRHNWHDRDESKWLFWLEKKLAELGFSVSMDALPQTAAEHLVRTVGEIQATHGISPNHTHIVRHDPGCLTLLKYCEEIIRRGITESTLLIAGIPKRNFSVLKMIGGPKALTVKEGEVPDYVPDPQELTLQTIELKLMVIYGGELNKALPARK